MIAHGAGLEAARAGEIAADGAAERAAAGGLAPHRTELRRLEGAHLVAGSDLPFPLGHRRSGPERADSSARSGVEPAGPPVEHAGLFTLARAPPTRLAGPAGAALRPALRPG